MDKKIPLTFNVVISSPLNSINPALPNVARAKCHVFTKYRNRNYSYITDEVATQLIESATQGTTPVVGFFDKETGDFTGHAGPELASVYGYVENFLGWEKVVDPADHIEREYATFSIVLFSDYLEAARSIVGKAQSMELDPNSIDGAWTAMGDDGMDYFVYSKARMKAFCVLGSGVEPCFSGSSFFSKDDGTQFEQFSKLLMDLQDKVKQYGGGQNAMNVKVNGVENEHFNDVFNALNPDFTEENPVIFELPMFIDDTSILTYACGGGKKKVKKYSYSYSEENELKLEEAQVFDYDELEQNEIALREEYEAFKVSSAEQMSMKESEQTELQNKFDALTAEKDALQVSYDELKASFEALQQEKTELANQYAAQAETLAARDATITEQASHIDSYEKAEKDRVIEKFSKCLPSDILSPIADRKDTLSIEALNTQLALEYTQFSMARDQGEQIRVPQVQPEPSKLATILNKYKK